ncbi:hypothetical protein DGN16_22605 [Xanthomonas citri pv. fuscans]|nr:hypothetical protein DGN16_22605 [Xanthomonas citri pv. fuscans]QWN09698.1 hypothetical protein DGN11_21975 [Xanthomonas citri pv. fuscans]QWN13900.1 hypothetical protein DGN07_22530 [Xanthomonas citri pv. fuscans]
MRVRAKPRALGIMRWLLPIPSPDPRPAPGPRRRCGRSKARAPVARKPCLLAPGGEGLERRILLPPGHCRPSWRRRCPDGAGEGPGAA